MARSDRFIDAFSPRCKVFIKSVLQSVGTVLSPQLMGNPHLAGKLYPYGGNVNGYVITQKDSDQIEVDERGLPIPPRGLRTGGMDTELFLISGKEDVERMLAILKQSNLSLGQGMRILDFGCASGRLLRWLSDVAATCEVWGVDISAEHIVWCQKYLSPPFKFVITTTHPHLPFEDKSFDFIYAGSVFTHIDDLADAWFLELRRILKIAGFLYVTVHDTKSLDIMRDRLAAHDPWARMVLQSQQFQAFGESDARMFTIGRSVYSHVFYSTNYLVQHLGTFFEVLSVTNEAFRGFQTGILLQKCTEKQPVG